MFSFICNRNIDMTLRTHIEAAHRGECNKTGGQTREETCTLIM